MDLHPKWPDLGFVLARNQYTLAYDGVSDTLFIDFYGPGRPAVNVEVERGDHDYLFQRVDVETEEIVGIQIEDFLAYAVHLDPILLDALDIVELNGIDPNQIRAIKRQHPFSQDRQPTAASFLGLLAKLTA